MDKAMLSKATLGRLPEYLNFLRDLPEETEYISATTIANALKYGEVQVRKDLNQTSGRGKPKVGYEIRELIKTLETHLGVNKQTKAVLVGAGKLGRALIDYEEFKKYGVEIAAAFDSNEVAISFGKRVEILPMNRFEAYCKAQNINLGIITVGEGSAQSVCDIMIKSGITKIWNFAPCKLTAGDGVILKNENLALSLAHLNNQLN